MRTRSVYDALDGRVVERAVPWARTVDAGYLARADVFHLDWPEWFLGPDPGRTRRMIAALRQAGVGIAWTQHNLGPHAGGHGDGPMAAVYDAWAEAADVVLHHSRWGEGVVRDRWRFRADALHVLVPHVHFGGLMTALDGDRAEAERELGLRSAGDRGVIRLAVFGAPRAEKDVVMVLDAFAACGREDLELLVLSLRPEEVELVPDDPRITALTYEEVPRAVYDRRLSTVDCAVLPFRSPGMLTTGTVGDVIGAGLPAVVSDWPFLTEVLGDAGISYGSTREGLTGCLEALDRAALARAAAASLSRRAACSPAAVADATFAALEAVTRPAL